jgi:hypothetical protein
MFRVSWAMVGDPKKRHYVLAENRKTVFLIVFSFEGYGRNDGCKPIDIKVHDIEGRELNVNSGIDGFYV